MTKKIYYTALILLATIPFLHSCGENGEKGDEPTSGPVTVDVTYQIDDMYELIQMVEITAEYTDRDGKMVTEEITTSSWSKTIAKINVPFTANLKITYKKRADFSADKDKYTVSNGVGINYKTSDGRNKFDEFSTSRVLSKNGVISYIDKLVNTPREVSQFIGKE